MHAEQIRIHEEQKELQREVIKKLEELKVDFLAMTNLKMNEVRYFSDRLRNLELFLVSHGFKAPEFKGDSR